MLCVSRSHFLLALSFPAPLPPTKSGDPIDSYKVSYPGERYPREGNRSRVTTEQLACGRNPAQLQLCWNRKPANVMLAWLGKQIYDNLVRVPLALLNFWDWDSLHVVAVVSSWVDWCVFPQGAGKIKCLHHERCYQLLCLQQFWGFLSKGLCIWSCWAAASWNNKQSFSQPICAFLHNDCSLDCLANLCSLESVAWCNPVQSESLTGRFYRDWPQQRCHNDDAMGNFLGALKMANFTPHPWPYSV